MTHDVQDWFNAARERIDRQLDAALGSQLGPSRLIDAARYSVLAGGKRLRPALVYAAAAATGAPMAHADSSAIAVELLHAYSLIHDDLPAMDDDALRRGQPTTHLAFDEATAILAGDALQALAFEILARDDGRSAETRIRQVQLLGQAVGFQGMALGQAIDLESEGVLLEIDALKAMHSKKTGALITASILMGAAAGAPLDAAAWSALTEAGEAIGLAFQIQDDILDVTATTESMGKEAGRDQLLEKSTFPKLLGLDGSRAAALSLVDTAHRALDRVPGRTDYLKGLATQSVERTH